MYSTPIAPAVAAVVASACLAACTGGSGDGVSDAEATRGGTLYYLTTFAAEHLDPQRIYVGRDLANLNRLVYRGLVTFPVTDDPAEANQPVPDIATDTGTPSEDASTWEFTIRDGVTWEDGKPVTCEDVKYGISRTFATDVITGGPNYILSYLDVPGTASGLPLYNGPYQGYHQSDYDKAVTCDGSKLTLRFNKPWPDFNLAAASLTAFSPFRVDKDKGARSNYQIFSSGPYKLDGSWDAVRGGTFVRNPEYDAVSDESGSRSAYPDEIVVTQGLENEVVQLRLIADSGRDRYAVTSDSVLPADYTRITGTVADRSTLVDSPFVVYLQPNFNTMNDLEVRRALMLSTDVTARITALGGDRTGTPARSVIHPNLIGYRDNPNFTAPLTGDPKAARALLEKSGEKLPYPLKLTYPIGTPADDKAAAALAEGWKRAGFEVTLEPVEQSFSEIPEKPPDFDVTLSAWGADWPSIATVIPPLYDSRINDPDWGTYQNAEVDRMIDEAAVTSDVDEQTAKYLEIDHRLGEDVAYIPLNVARFYLLRGSRVTGYVNNPATGGYPDLGGIGVEN